MYFYQILTLSLWLCFFPFLLWLSVFNRRSMLDYSFALSDYNHLSWWVVLSSWSSLSPSARVDLGRIKEPEILKHITKSYLVVNNNSRNIKMYVIMVFFSTNDFYLLYRTSHEMYIAWRNALNQRQYQSCVLCLQTVLHEGRWARKLLFA